MKHLKKKLLALVLIAVMLFSMNSISILAASTDSYEVTVYVTCGMFTYGGYDYDTYSPIEREVIQADPEDHLFGWYEVVNVDGLTISSTVDRSVYSAPATLSEDANILDAIVFALEFNGFECSGGWDCCTSPNGGYIHDVLPGGAGSISVTFPVINNVQYTCYSGTGWTIALRENGVNTEIEHYGTYYPIEDGMEIIFDYSPFLIFEEVVE